MTHNILNLNEDKTETHEFFFFGGGEGHIKLIPHRLNLHEIKILICFRNDTSIFRVLLAVDALRGVNPDIKIELYIPYFPGGRQDRRCVEGEPLTVGVYASVINTLKLNRVHIFDPHSDVTPALINNVKVHKNHNYVADALHYGFCRVANGWESIVLVSPDSGANKKVFDLAKYLKLDAIRADKIRDVATGNIVETTVYSDDLTGKFPLIVDDVCSKGGTFMGLAKALKAKNAEKIGLVLSFWEGIADLRKMKESGIDQIYITNGLANSYGLANSSDLSYVKEHDIFQYMGVFEQSDTKMEDRSKVGYF